MRKDFLSDDSCLLKQQHGTEDTTARPRVGDECEDTQHTYRKENTAAPTVFLAKFGQAVRCLGRIEATARALYAIVAGAGDSGFRTKFNKTRNQETKCKIQTNIILDYISWGTIQLALMSRLCQCNNLNPFENRRLSRIQAIHPCRQWESNASGLVRSCIFMAKT